MDDNETLEAYAFMEAADESFRRGGDPVSVVETLKIPEIILEMKKK